MNLEGFAVEEKGKPTVVEQVMGVVVGLDRMEQKTRVILACYLVSIAVYTACYFTFGFLGVFVFGIVSLLIFEKIPYLTLVALFLVILSGGWILLDITGLGIKVKAGLDWLLGQPFSKPVKPIK
jgi:hypothetical protein